MAHSKGAEDDQVIILQGPPLSNGSSTSLVEYPFYMKQPTEKMDRLFNKYKDVLTKALGESVVSINPMGSGSIRGMPGSPMIDIMVSLKNYPPTAEQLDAMQSLNFGMMFGSGKAPHTDDDTWMGSTDFPPHGDFEEFKVDGKFPPEGHLGRVIIHLLHYSNPFVVRTQAYTRYLNSNEDAFRRYRDVKVQGAKVGPSSEDDNTQFFKYKGNKIATVRELAEEAMAWKEENGIKFLEEQIS